MYSPTYILYRKTHECSKRCTKVSTVERFKKETTVSQRQPTGSLVSGVPLTCTPLLNTGTEFSHSYPVVHEGFPLCLYEGPKPLRGHNEESGTWEGIWPSEPQGAALSVPALYLYKTSWAFHLSWVFQIGEESLFYQYLKPMRTRWKLTS